MKKHRIFRPRRFFAALMAGTSVFLAACQPTPETEIISQKEDINKVVEEYAQTQDVFADSETPSGETEGDSLSQALAQSLGAPETVSFQVSVPNVGNGTTTITAEDAQVILPAVDHLGAAVVSRGDLTAEQIKEIGDAFFEGRTPYEPVPDTKEDYMEQIQVINDQYESYLEDGISEDELAPLMVQMDSLRERMASAPSRDDVTLNPMSYEWQEYPGVSGLEQIVGENNEDPIKYRLSASREDSFFYFNLSKNANIGNGTKNLSSKAGILSSMAVEDVSAVEKAFSENRCDYSEEDAIQLCLDYLENLGISIDGLEVSAVDPLVWYDYMDNSVEDGVEGYEIYFSHGVNHVPQTRTTNSIAYVPDGGKVTYDYERLYMRVEDAGVTFLFWQNPMTMGETLAQKVELLPFDQVLEIITGHVTLAYENYAMDERLRDGESLTVDRITLGMMRVQNENNENDFTLIPVWDVFSTQLGDYSLVTVNAMDGSIITRENGY